MKVAIVSHSYLAKENQKNLSEIGKKVELMIISPSSSNNTLFSYKNDKEHDVIIDKYWKMHMYSKIPLFRRQYFLSSLSFNFNKFKPDIVHIEYDPWIPLFWQALIITKLFAKSAFIICTVKQNTYSTYNAIIQQLKDSIAKHFIKYVSCFMAVNTGVSSIYQQRFDVKESKIVLVTQLGVDVNLFCPSSPEAKQNSRRQFSLPESSLLIGYCGRFDEDKGLEDLIEGVKIARKISGKDLKLALIGNGKMKYDLEIFKQSERWIYILPVIPHARIPEFLKCLDIFALPSRIKEDHVEHDGHALLEAMACGLPCIGTTSGVIPEILEDNGLVVEARQPKELTRAILKIINNHDLANSFCKSGREKIIKEFSIGAVAKRKVNTYLEVFREKKY